MVGADELRRHAIERAFSAAGFHVVTGESVAELGLGKAPPPSAVIFDSIPPDVLDRELSAARERWRGANVWAVHETARLLAGQPSDEAPDSTAQHVYCEGVLQQALRDLTPKGGEIPLDLKILRAKQELENLLDGSPDPIFVLADDLTILRANRAFFSRVGKSPSEVIGRHCVEILRGTVASWNQCLWAKALESPGPFQWRLPEVALGQPFECTAFPIQTGDQGTAVAHHLREIGGGAPDRPNGGAPTFSMLGRAAANMVHELSNPLSAMVGFAESLEGSGACPEEMREDLQQMRQEAERCRRIISNLLSLARTPEPNPQPTDINELVERAIAVRVYQPGDGGAGVIRNLASDMPRVMVDPDQIEQIVLNLLTNAEEAVAQREQGPRVTVTTRTTGSEIIITVADNGPGIDPEHLPLIFNPLFSAKPSGKGTGLGLSVSQTLARQHGGGIMVRSRPGAGAVFTLRLPMVTTGEGADRAAGLRTEDQEARVLIADDEPVVRRVVGAVLRSQGYTVVESAALDEAAQAIESEPFDVVIADVGLAESGGGRLMGLLRRRPELMKGLILTTGGLDLPPGGEEQRGPNPVLRKPFTPDQVRRAVRAALGS